VASKSALDNSRRSLGSSVGRCRAQHRLAAEGWRGDRVQRLDTPLLG